MAQQQQNLAAYQAQIIRAQLAQLAQMQMVQQQQQQQQSQGQQDPQQQQMPMTAAGGNDIHHPQNSQAANLSQRYSQLYQQRLFHLRQEMATRYMTQYGPPAQYPPQIAHQYSIGLEWSARAWVREVIRRERAARMVQSRQ